MSPCAVQGGSGIYQRCDSQEQRDFIFKSSLAGNPNLYPHKMIRDLIAEIK